MKKRGSQIRETVKQAKCKVIQYRNKDLIIVNIDGDIELWSLKDDYAGYVLVYDGVGFEFQKRMSTNELYERIK